MSEDTRIGFFSLNNYGITNWKDPPFLMGKSYGKSPFLMGKKW
jgi:hypothetical protein